MLCAVWVGCLVAHFDCCLESNLFGLEAVVLSRLYIGNASTRRYASYPYSTTVGEENRSNRPISKVEYCVVVVG